MPDILEKLRAARCVVTPCGSRVTCVPPPTDTDADYLVAVKPWSDDVEGLLIREGFDCESDEYVGPDDDMTFTSWRRGEVNLIVSDSVAFVDRHHAATKLCSRLNLMDKEDRIALFEAVLYGYHAQPKTT